MTALDLDAIKARARDAGQAAMSDQWEVAYDGDYHVRVCTTWDRVADDMVEEAAELLAHAIVDIPALVAEVERLRGVVQGASAALATPYPGQDWFSPLNLAKDWAAVAVDARTILSRESSDSSSTGGEL